MLSLLLTGWMAIAPTQSTPAARLQVTVVDQTGAVVPNATVTLIRLDEATKTATPTHAITSDKGMIVFDRVVPGRYRIEARFEGFEVGVLTDVRIRGGDNKQVMILRLKSIEESVTVAQNAQAAAADPRGNGGRTVLSREEIEALSDDPIDMAQQLQDMAGGNATIKVDSFAGAPLPPKALIKSIHIVRDPFAAENHSAEAEEIDIITQPGIGPLRGNFSTRLRDGAFTARSPFTATKGPERQESVEGNVGGTLINGKSSFSLSVEGRNAFDTPNLFANLPTGTESQVLNLRRPAKDLTVYGLVDYAVTRDQILRFAYDQTTTTRDNLGVGGPNLIDRAYSTDSENYEFRAQLVGPLGRRAFANTRLQLLSQNTNSVSAFDTPTVVVNGGFTSGSANVTGGRHPKTLEFASDVDYVRGMHTIRTGVQIDAGRYRADDSTDYLGTYTFPSVAAFAAGQPSLYTRRIGDPLIVYNNFQAAAYVQDDLRVRKNLTLSPGVRFEAQSHLPHDHGDLGPRMGITWAPFRSGHTTVRGSAGLFYNWLNASVYEQTLRVDGFRQQELIVQNPTYPVPPTAGPTTTTNKYVLGPDVHMTRTTRISAGLDQTLTPKIRVSFTYSQFHGVQLVGTNLNAPLNGVRPDPAFANVIEVLSEAGLDFHQLSSNVTMNFAGGVRNANQARWNARRTTLRVTYWIARISNNTDGPFVPPPSGSLATEWAPAPGERRNRVEASVNSQALKNLNATIGLAASTGTPFSILTGFDDNGDTIFNDRPVGVGRDTLRTAGQASVRANINYTVSLGTVRTAADIQERGGGEQRGGAPASGRYRLVFTLAVTNLTNRPNFTGYSGVLTSPTFALPTAVLNPRRVDFGVSLRF